VKVVIRGVLLNKMTLKEIGRKRKTPGKDSRALWFGYQTSLLRVEINHPFDGLAADRTEADKALGEHPAVDTRAIQSLGHIAGSFEGPYLGAILLLYEEIAHLLRYIFQFLRILRVIFLQGPSVSV